jgi:GH25 family lysozyme M1 (1,4-beta-N-acetylmuramidase)
MSKNKLISSIVSVITAAVMTFGICSYTVYADNISGNTASESSEPEEDMEEDGFEENDLLAIAGAFNDEPEVTVPARRIRLKTGSINTLALGQTSKIIATLTPSNSDDIITYKSLNRSIAQVDENGYVTAVGIGQTSIKLTTTSGAKSNVQITVTENLYSSSSDGSISDDDETEIITDDEDDTVYGDTELEVESIEIADSNIMLRKGKTISIEYVLYPLGSSDTVTFSSSNSSVAAVSSKGVIKGKSAGTATITVKTSSGIKASCSVTVYSGVYKGIDVSKWQGTISWKKVKAAGIDFAMIRSSFGDSNVDERLKTNVAGCEKYDIPYGFYHYCYAKTVAEAKKEARFFLKTIKKYSPEYPVVLDIEESFYNDMTRKQVTDIICAFMEELEDAGYYAMIYSYANFFKDNTTISRLTKYDIWVACWGDTDKLNSSYDYHYGMWQYSATGSVSGISGDVDLDYAYKDYASRIRKNGLNNLT